MHKLNLVIVVVIVLLAASCRGGSTPVVTQNPDGQQAVLASLAAGTTGKATLRGTITLDGLTPAGPVGTPTSGTVMGKIIAPGDDILKAVPITPGTQFEAVVDQAVPLGKLQLTTSVNEDINGDGTTPDTVTLELPVNLPAGRISTINATIHKATKLTGPPTAGQGAAEDAFFPATGLLLLVDLAQSDAGGSKTDFFAVTPGGSTVFDADGDRFIETGDDTAYADANHNGWPDTSEAALTDAAATNLKLSGTVAEVSRNARTLSLREDGAGSDATPDAVTVDPFAAIVPLADDGTPLGGLLLDQSLVGRQVQVYGVRDNGANFATLVVVLPVSTPAK